MEITSVEVTKYEKEGSRMKARVSVVIDDCLKIKNIRVIEGVEKLHVAMPSTKSKTEEGKHFDIVHPINQETRDMFTDKILEAYHNAE